MSHVVAFLLLHEATAIVPLVGLFGLFHWGGQGWVPSRWTDSMGASFQEGTERAERYFRRKRWFGFEPGEVDRERAGDEGGKGDAEMRRRGEGGYKIVAEVALAYAITKAFLPVRILASLWATPWCARGLVRARAMFASLRRR